MHRPQHGHLVTHMPASDSICDYLCYINIWLTLTLTLQTNSTHVSSVDEVTSAISSLLLLHTNQRPRPRPSWMNVLNVTDQLSRFTSSTTLTFSGLVWSFIKLPFIFSIAKAASDALLNVTYAMPEMQHKLHNEYSTLQRQEQCTSCTPSLSPDTTTEPTHHLCHLVETCF